MSYIYLFLINDYEWIYLYLMISFLFLITFNNFVSFYFKSKSVTTEKNNDISPNSNYVSNFKTFLNSRGIYFRLDNTEAIHLMFFLGPLILVFSPDFYYLIVITAIISLIISILSMVIRNKRIIFSKD